MAQDGGGFGVRARLWEAEVKQRKRRKDTPVVVTGIAWYRESDWPRVKTLFPDADELHDTYAEWLRSAESVVRHLGRGGVAARPFVIDIDHFIGWCSAQGRSLDAEARSAYVVEMLRLQPQAPELRIEPSST